jgi:alanine racemase
MTMRPCWVETDTHAFEENYRYLSGLAGGDAELLAVVKANAYGHSVELCAPAALRAGARWLGVTSVEEGLAARAACRRGQDAARRDAPDDTRILVMSGCFLGDGSAVVEHGLTPLVWESWQLDELDAAARAGGRLPVHLEIDTGMSRQGIGLDDLGPLLKRFGPRGPLLLEGVMTHLLAADELDGRLTVLQLTRLKEAVGQIQAAGLRPKWLSVGNSASLLHGDAPRLGATAARFGMKAMMRPGLSLYGLSPQFVPEEPAAVTKARARLKPVLSWKAQVVGVRTVPAGSVVGYNATFVATEPMRLALLAVGYADGLDRRLGNRFSLLVRGERGPLVGRVSMDQAVIDVTDIPGVTAGDEVVILGSQGAETITAFDHAEATETIPWEVFTRIGARVERRATSV